MSEGSAALLCMVVMYTLMCKKLPETSVIACRIATACQITDFTTRITPKGRLLLCHFRKVAHL